MNDKKIGCVQHDCQECKDRERQSVPAGLQNIDRSVIEQALEWVEAQPEPRMLGAAKIITSLREALAAPQPQPVQQEIVAWLVTGPSEKRSFDMQSFAESWCKGLNKGFGEDVYKISNLVVQSSEPHEKCNDERMCAACYSGQGKCKTQPVQQEPVAWAYTTNGLHTNFTEIEPPDDAYDDGSLMALYTSPQAAQPLSDDRIDVLWEQIQTQQFKSHGEQRMDFARAVEQAHGITKGTT